MPCPESYKVIHFNKLTLLLFTTASLSSIPHISNAACSRDDVQFYLDKGFSTDQITSLCDTTATQNKSHDTSSTLPKESISSSAVILSSADNTKENKTEHFLREAIKGRDVSLSNESLDYTLKVCIKYGEEDLFGFTPKACPNVRFNIALKDLKVKEPKKSLFFNPDGIDIKGNITRDVINGLEEYKTEDQKLILNKLESGNKTTIPVRDDISIEKIFQTLDHLTL